MSDEAKTIVYSTTTAAPLPGLTGVVAALATHFRCSACGVDRASAAPLRILRAVDGAERVATLCDACATGAEFALRFTGQL